MVAFVTWVHVLCGMGYLALTVSSFACVSLSLRQKNLLLLQDTLKTTLKWDCLQLPMMVVIVLTGAFMAEANHIPPGTPWVTVAYILFALVGLCWFLLVMIKLCSLSRNQFQYPKLFYFLNIVIIILFCIIVHDAVTQQTWFW